MDTAWLESVQEMKIPKIHWNGVYKTFSRRRKIDESVETDKTLSKCLSTLDLTFLGIGSTLGVGVYVLAGQVSKEEAGPAVILSFAIAAIASMIAGLCYAEFGARVPKAGSAYIYSYVTVGEFIAFLMGWTLILEYVIGSASVVRALSQYVDGLFDGAMTQAFENAAPIRMEHFSNYTDFFALGVTMSFSAVLAFGAKESSVANNIFTLGNLAVVVFVIIAGSFKANWNNWKLPPRCQEKTCKKLDYGGFAPFGIAGIFKGASTCFYGFIGFDCVATTGEEARNPQRSIPIAIVASLTVVFFAYFAISTILTTVLPYYDQDVNTPFPHMFNELNWPWARYIVSVGAIFALCTSLLGSLYPLPRVIYAMACDGLIFKFMGTVHPRFHTPLVGTLSAGLLTGILAAIFQLQQLMHLMNICTLLTYSIVAACVLILRYEESKSYEKREDLEKYSVLIILNQLVNKQRLTYSTRLTSQIVTGLVFCFFVVSIVMTGIITKYPHELSEGDFLIVIPVIILGLSLVCILMFIHMQPSSDKQLSFSVPFVPFLPGLSILINIYLMVALDAMTWVKFIIWMLVGLGIYFFYGVWNSNIRYTQSSSNKHLSMNNLNKEESE